MYGIRSIKRSTTELTLFSRLECKSYQKQFTDDEEAHRGSGSYHQQALSQAEWLYFHSAQHLTWQETHNLIIQQQIRKKVLKLKAWFDVVSQQLPKYSYGVVLSCDLMLILHMHHTVLYWCVWCVHWGSSADWWQWHKPSCSIFCDWNKPNSEN